MKRFALRHCIAAASLIAIACAGCEHSSQGNTAKAALPKQGAQEKFDRIVDSVRRKIEDQPVNLIVSEGGSRTTMVGSNKVTSAMTPPTTPNEHYKATITITSQSQYSLRHSKNSEENERDQSARNQQHKSPLDRDDKNAKDYPTTANNSQSADDSKSGKNDAKSNDSSVETVTRRPDQQTRQYDFVYENDKWLLVTQLNPKTEKSIQFAFEEALSEQ